MTERSINKLSIYALHSMENNEQYTSKKDNKTNDESLRDQILVNSELSRFRPGIRSSVEA